MHHDRMRSLCETILEVSVAITLQRTRTHVVLCSCLFPGMVKVKPGTPLQPLMSHGLSLCVPFFLW